jgi:histidinol-phosphate aminotransferase
MSGVAHLLRPELRDFTAYHAASPRRGVVRLHANESSWRSDWDETSDGLNRYPDPRPAALVGALAVALRRGARGGARHARQRRRDRPAGARLLPRRGGCRAGLPADLRHVCRGARLQGAEVIEVPLKRTSPWTRAGHRGGGAPGREAGVPVFAQQSDREHDPAKVVDALCRALDGHCVVVVDEAYVEFARDEGCAGLLEAHPNLVLLRTLSKAWGLAGARIGAVLADP